MASDADQRPLRRYLQSRNIDQLPQNALLLPPQRSPSMLELGVVKGFPAIVFPVGSAQGLAGAHVTFLSRNGSSKLATDKPKKMFGPIKGAYVKLSPFDKAERLIVGEGIESTLSAMQIAELPGVATLSAAGMAAVQLPPCREVIIAADNDEPGLKAAKKLASRLAHDHTVRIAVPEFQGEDWNDVLRNDGDQTGMLARDILEAPLYEATTTAGALTAQELLEPWLETGSLAMLHAQRGHGKTRFLMSCAQAIATGKRFLLWQVRRAVRVLYVDGELPIALLQKRVRALGPAAPNLLLLSRDVMLREAKTLPDLATAEGRDFLGDIILKQKIEVVILDSLSTLVRSGVENDAESWSPIQDWLLGLRFRGCTVILVHHEGRSGNPRGTSKREDALDSILQLKERDEQAEQDGESSYELRFRKTREFGGEAKAPLLLRMSHDDGRIVWRHESLRDHTREHIVELRAQGLTQQQIADEVGLTQGQVSRLLN
jgi:putative DNA primase/helicase